MYHLKYLYTSSTYSLWNDKCSFSVLLFEFLLGFLRRIYSLTSWNDFWKILPFVTVLSDSGNLAPSWKERKVFRAPAHAGQREWLEVVKAELENWESSRIKWLSILNLCFTRWTYKFVFRHYFGGLVSSTRELMEKQNSSLHFIGG